MSRANWISAESYYSVRLDWVAVAVPIVFGLVNPTQIQAESQTQKTNAIAPAYEVASIKPNKSDNGLFRMMFEQDGFSAASVTLRMPIRTAYEVNDHQIIGVPIWLNSEKYDIEARMDSSVTDGLQKISEDQRRVEKRRMLQALLADRFKLMLHRETKQLLACTYWSLPRTAPNFRRPNPATLTRRE